MIFAYRLLVGAIIICSIFPEGRAGAGAGAGAGEIVEEARTLCQDFSGRFSIRGEAIHQFDFGNDTPHVALGDRVSYTVVVVDESKFICSNSATLYCGTGGCQLHAIGKGWRASWMVLGWRIERWGSDTIFLLARDGVLCGGLGSDVCYQALVRSEGRFVGFGPGAAVKPPGSVSGSK